MEKLSLRFQILDESVAVESDALPAQVRLDELLPALRILDDGAMAIAVKKEGREVSCAKGCSVCCRIQLVPVTPAEAYALWRLVEALPEPRRGEVRGRFAERIGRLEAAGLADFFRRTDSQSLSEEMRVNMGRYLELGLACPFLDADICTIYDVRPFACREYLVTTPKALCAEPLSGSVRVVPRILPLAWGTMDAAAGLGGGSQQTLPLIFALEYAEGNREALERLYPAGRAISQSIGRVFSRAYALGSLLA